MGQLATENHLGNMVNELFFKGKTTTKNRDETLKMLHNNHTYLIFILVVGGYGAGVGVNPAAAKYGRHNCLVFFTAKKIFIPSKNPCDHSFCYCLAPGYGGFGTQGNAAGKYGE